ncbi:MAG: cyclase family protein [Thermomicrobium sp.]|nr:cyclase family protein [Thermomicrobium sp.]MDW7981996.1 cyclase family protein [Thermomicrobium sp.]
MTILDLTHPFEPEIPMFPGLPKPEVTEYWSRTATAAHYAAGTSFVVHRYAFVGNAGTYLDSPFHRYPDGVDLAGLPLERVVQLVGVVIDVRWSVARGQLAIGPERFRGLDLRGKAVLVCTGWDRYWGSERYLAANPHLTRQAAERFVSAGVALVGIDSWNVDDVADRVRPVHSVLLAAGIPIVENLCNLTALIGKRFRFHAAPIPIRGGSAVPVRAYAVLNAVAER